MSHGHAHAHGHGHGHGHGHPAEAPVRTRPPATGAPTAPGVGAVIGWVSGRPVPRAPLDRRIAELRDGPLSAALPAPGSSEDRQLARWLTQVILTEMVCEEEALRLGLSPVEGPALDRLAAVELGSITASAYNGSPWVKALFEQVRAEVPDAWRAGPAGSPPEAPVEVRHQVFAEAPSGPVGEQELEALGETSLDTLPSAIAAELRRQPYGTLVGPVRDALGWHVAVARPARTGGGAVPDGAVQEDRLVEAARRRAFARWLDRLRAERVELVPGLEHPGDPRQPDNHHKH
ncbi:DUF7158 domain-containing protein [Nonomuraea typhae]|uniref:DUF7158 domain-containing protein n=1 Tax=Nonomuraea typhae TaxID=2603600 RepID=UPI001CA474FF|nr:hypothetical protein [Nonomuraea typhae]